MASFLTNIMISLEPHFSQFNCFRAPLKIDERDAWKERHKYTQPMVPSENFLFFVSKKSPPSFIDTEAIVEVTLNSNDEEHYRILRYLVHQTLRIFLVSKGLSEWNNFYTKKEFMTSINGRFGRTYNIFNGIRHTVFFEEGYCLIAFNQSSKIFTKLPTSDIQKTIDTLRKFSLITLCEDCKETNVCQNVHHKVSKFSRLEDSRVFMVDIEGREFDCPVSSVRIESNPRVMKGEYARILRRTALTTSEEQHFVSELVNSLSKGDFKLDLGKEICFSWLKLEAE